MAGSWSIHLGVTPFRRDEGLSLLVESRPRNDLCSVWVARGHSLPSIDVLRKQTPTRRIPESEASPLIDALRTAKISAAPRGVLGLDGKTYTLEVISGLHTVRYTWWSALPEEWAALSPVYDRLVKLANGANAA